MKHLKAINQKAARIEAHTTIPIKADPATPETTHGSVCLQADPATRDVVALQQPPPAPHIPLGCSFLFSPGWETDQNGGTAGLCQPVERDLFDCHLGCFWPAQVPDQLNNAPDWTAKCAAAQKDWRNIDLIFP